jgi:AbrB family looped-hinge helix DNA binding protein
MEEKMSRKSTKIPTCSPLNREGSFWRVESIVSIDERGQMVLPKELRDKAKIGAGEKLALISWDKGGEICCLYLIKTEHLAESVKGFLGPMAREVVS